MKNSQGRFSKWAKTVQPYVLDFLVVVLGIMLSLWFNDRRQQNETRNEEKQILEQVLEDIKADTARISDNLKELKELVNVSLKFLQISRDSILNNCTDAYMNSQSVITYVPFDPSKAGYYELSNQGKSGKVTDKKLLMDVMDLHENGYKRIMELTNTHREYLINNINSYIVQNMPYVDLLKKTEVPQNVQQRVANTILDDRFKHMLFFDIVLKQNLGQAYISVNEAQKTLIVTITEKLAHY